MSPDSGRSSAGPARPLPWKRPSATRPSGLRRSTRSAVLIHGDGHAGNVLLKPGPDGGTSFRLIDPEGLISNPRTIWGSRSETAMRNCLLATPPRRWNDVGAWPA